MSQTMIPITVLSGTLGAGRTTGLNYRLTPRTDVDTAVLVTNRDVATIDADRIAEHATISGDNEDRCRA